MSQQSHLGQIHTYAFQASTVSLFNNVGWGDVLRCWTDFWVCCFAFYFWRLGWKVKNCSTFSRSSRCARQSKRVSDFVTDCPYSFTTAVFLVSRKYFVLGGGGVKETINKQKQPKKTLIFDQLFDKIYSNASLPVAEEELVTIIPSLKDEDLHNRPFVSLIC